MKTDAWNNLSQWLQCPQSSRKNSLNIVESSLSEADGVTVLGTATELQSLFASVAFLPPSQGLSIFSAQSFDSQTAFLTWTINQANNPLTCSSRWDVKSPKEKQTERGDIFLGEQFFKCFQNKWLLLNVLQSNYIHKLTIVINTNYLLLFIIVEGNEERW